MDRIKVGPLPFGPGLLVAVGGLAVRPAGGGPSESRRVVCWGLGREVMYGRAGDEGVGSQPRAAILSSRNICPCSHVVEDVPQRSALKY